MAAPLVSAAIALIETVNLGLSRQEVREILFSGADNISRLNPDYNGRLGAGRLNVFRSVSSAKARLDALNVKLIIGPAGPGEQKMKIAEPGGRLINELSLIRDTFGSKRGFYGRRHKRQRPGRDYRGRRQR
jgi:hypothetical protein